MNFQNKLIALTVFLFLIVFVKNGNALKCWECDSNTDTHCADPFMQYTITLTDCNRVSGHHPRCRKIKQPANGRWRYIRGCDSDQFVNYTPEADSIEFCEDDYCNSANSRLPNLLTFITPVLVGVYYFLK